jgi:hypothetical protein
MEEILPYNYVAISRSVLFRPERLNDNACDFQPVPNGVEASLGGC